MREQTYEEYLALKGNPHDFLRSRFQTMIFQLLGSSHLVDFLIRYNVAGGVQPQQLVEQFSKLWENYRGTDGYKQSVERSRPGGPDHLRRSQQIWQLTKKLDRAKWIDDWIKEDWDNWYGLTESDKTLWQQRQSDQLEEQCHASAST